MNIRNAKVMLYTLFNLANYEVDNMLAHWDGYDGFISVVKMQQDMYKDGKVNKNRRMSQDLWVTEKRRVNSRIHSTSLSHDKKFIAGTVIDEDSSFKSRDDNMFPGITQKNRSNLLSMITSHRSSF